MASVVTLRPKRKDSGAKIRMRRMRERERLKEAVARQAEDVLQEPVTRSASRLAGDAVTAAVTNPVTLPVTLPVTPVTVRLRSKAVTILTVTVAISLACMSLYMTVTWITTILPGAPAVTTLGVTLEAGKLIAVTQASERNELLFRISLLAAVALLVIVNMGCAYGYLSSIHLASIDVSKLT